MVEPFACLLAIYVKSKVSTDESSQSIYELTVTKNTLLSDNEILDAAAPNKCSYAWKEIGYLLDFFIEVTLHLK